MICDSSSLHLTESIAVALNAPSYFLLNSQFQVECICDCVCVMQETVDEKACRVILIKGTFNGSHESIALLGCNA